MAYPYTSPDFLKNQSVDEIHNRMLSTMPEDIDKSENQIPWDFTRPAAIEKAELVEFELNEAIKCIFPQWAYNEWLNYHAQMNGLARRAANKASGTILASGVAGTIIPKGFQFATQANQSASILYESTEEVTLKETETTIPIQAIHGGTSSNVPPDTVILMVKPEKGIRYLTNPQPISGGTKEESDDELRERILDIARGGVSFTGCDADYIRWAKEVSGVGNAIVDAEWDGAGTVRLYVVDSNGAPANQQILDAVYQHIINPDYSIERLAPIGAKLTVTAPTPLEIDISAKVHLKEGENLITVTERFKKNLDVYFMKAANAHDKMDVFQGKVKSYVRYVQVGAVLAETIGVADYEAFIMNGSNTNVEIDIGEFPLARLVSLYE